MGKTGLIVVIVLLSIILLPLAVFTQMCWSWPGNEGSAFWALIGCVIIIIFIVFCGAEIKRINDDEYEEKEEERKKDLKANQKS